MLELDRIGLAGIQVDFGPIDEDHNVKADRNVGLGKLSEPALYELTERIEGVSDSVINHKMIDLVSQLTKHCSGQDLDETGEIPSFGDSD